MERIEYDKESPKSIERYAQSLLGKTFQEVLDDDNADDTENKKNKGDLGQLIERHYFHYECNSDINPDFKEAGVELKVTPYKENKNGSISAKERLVLTKINYYGVVNEEFETSHFWTKSQLLLLIYYLYSKEVKKRFEYEIKYSKLFTPPAEDVLIIHKDYDIIVNKVKAGLANKISESDTMYLAACTKGVKGTDRTGQPFSNEKAKPRAFSFKQSYMTYVLNSFVVPGKDTYKPALTAEELYEHSFEDALRNRILKYVGMYEDEITRRVGKELNQNNKSFEASLVYRMLGVKSNRVEEFVKAGIIVKIITYRKKKTNNQEFRLNDVKLIDFNNEKFDDEIIYEETNEPIGWESSELYDILKNRKYFFAVFWETDEGYIFKGSQLWGMSDDDIEKVREVWKRSKEIVRAGIKLERTMYGTNPRVENNLPGIKDNGIFHFRPHASKSYYLLKDGKIIGNGTESDSDLLPNGERMTRQAYWLNRSYIDDQIQEELRKKY